MKLKKLVVPDQLFGNKIDIVKSNYESDKYMKGFISKVKINVDKIYRKEKKGEGEYNELYTEYSVIA